MRKELLSKEVKHIDITSFDARNIVNQMSDMSFTSRDLSRASGIFEMMLRDDNCAIILTLAGSTSAGGCMKIYSDMIKYNMVDAIVATGASIVDMDFFEALGFKHYQALGEVDDNVLRDNCVDRIYDTYIDEEDLKKCDYAVLEIANRLEKRPYSSREFIMNMGAFLKANKKKEESLVELAYDYGVPIFCPAFTDSSAGFGLVAHQVDNPKSYLSIDSVADFRELTEVKINAQDSGLFMIGGGVPKNFAQDTVVCAQIVGQEAAMHKYAVQITVADSRDGACSSSTLKEASSWGKVSTIYEQMVYAEATSVLPLIISAAYHNGSWKSRKRKNFNKIF